MLREEEPYAVLDLVDSVGGNAADILGDLLGRNAMHATDIHLEIAARDILLLLEYLKRNGQGSRTNLGIKDKALESGHKGAFKLFGKKFNILRMAFGTILRWARKDLACQ